MVGHVAQIYSPVSERQNEQVICTTCWQAKLCKMSLTGLSDCSETLGPGSTPSHVLELGGHTKPTASDQGHHALVESEQQSQKYINRTIVHYKTEWVNSEVKINSKTNSIDRPSLVEIFFAPPVRPL
jgi:hypothetical protein